MPLNYFYGSDQKVRDRIPNYHFLALHMNQLQLELGKGGC